MELLVRPDHLPLALQDPKHVPQAAKKKKFRQVKAAGEGLEGFVDWTNPVVSESTEEREAEMSGLVAGFAMRMRKCAANAQEETTPDLEVLGGKRFRLFGFNKEVQADPDVITVD